MMGVDVVSEKVSSATPLPPPRTAVPENREFFFSSLLDGSPNPILVLNLDASVRYTNSEFEQQTGFASSELNSIKPPYPWWQNDVEGRFYKLLEKRRREGTGTRVTRVRRLFRKKNGQCFWVELSTSMVTDDSGATYFMTTWVDITRRLDEEETARTLINAAADAAMLIDLDQRILAINRVGARRFGRSPDDLVGEDYFETIPAELVNVWQKYVRKTTATRKRSYFESEHEGVHYFNSVCPIFNTQEEVFRLALFAHDITDRKHTEKKCATPSGN